MVSEDRKSKIGREIDFGEKSDFSVFDHLLEGCQIIDRNWKYLYVNEAVIKHARLEKEDLLGRTMMEAYPDIENTRMFATLQKVMEEREPQQIENQFIFPDGQIGWFILSIQPIQQGILILSYEITKQKLVTDQLTLQRDRLFTLRQIDLAIKSTTDLDVVIGFVLEQITNVFNIDAAQVFLYDERSLMLQSYLQRGLEYLFKDTPYEIRIGESIVGTTGLERKTSVIKNITPEIDSTVHGNLLRKDKIVCCISTPLIYNGQLVGVLEAYHRSRKEPDEDWINYFETVAGQAAVAINNLQHINHLEKFNLELELAYDQLIESWAKTMSFRGCTLNDHNHRTMVNCIELALMMGYKEEELINIRRGALLHDIGMLTIPKSILCKQNKLDDNEWHTIHKHPAVAVEMLSGNTMLKRALDIPQYHHEWWDGSGYPYGFSANLIPEPARIFAVVDVWDSLRSERPYRHKWSDQRALEHIISEAGSHFDPHIVEIFVDYLNKQNMDLKTD